MNRVHPMPKELLAMPPEDAYKLKKLDVEQEERKLITEFSWDVAVNLFEKKMKARLGRAEIYFLDGHLILDERYLQNVTEEICQEYGLDLLTIIADIALPVGFGYPSLIGSLPNVVDDAFQPAVGIIPGQRRQKKIILWVEDEHWNNPDMSILTTLLQSLLISKAEPFLIAPNKYFDGEVMATFSRTLFDAKENDGLEVPNPEDAWTAYAVFVKFGFLMALRASLHSRLIILHFGRKMRDKIDAFKLLTLADMEGHEIVFLTNKDPTERKMAVEDCVTALKDIPNVFTSNTGILRFGSSGSTPPGSFEDRRRRVSSDTTASVTTEEVLMMDLDCSSDE